jgi:hypothetical protein
MKIVLAYSGGLDTSVIVKWLKETYDAEIVTFAADVGQEEELKGLDKKALKTGASKHYTLDLVEEFASDFIYPMIRANAIYEGQYYLGTSIARPLIAKAQVDIAKKEKADTVAHGATGKGNDQCRFELTYMALAPQLQIIAPWKMESYRALFEAARALLPADGFFEWQSRIDAGTGRSYKQPWLFRRRDQAPFWLGGLWDRWVGPDGSEVETCCLLTCAPNPLLARVHDRMPVVIPDGLEEPWLEPLDGPGLRALEPLLLPWDPAAWEAVKVEMGILRPDVPKEGGDFPNGRRSVPGDLEPTSPALPVVGSQDRDRGAAVGSVQLDLLDGSGA